jgi:hypothetical protein
MKTNVECLVLEGEELEELLCDANLGLNGHPLNPVIAKVSFVTLPSQSIICEIIMGEGHAVVDFSRPINPDDYVQEKGQIAAFRKTRDELWSIIAYRAKLENNPKLVAGLVDLYKV